MTVKPENRGRSGRFRRGESGNPGGRPKDEHGVRDLARELGPRAIKKLEELMGSLDERVALAASNAILDRGFGKATASDSATDDLLSVEIRRFYEPIRIPVHERDPLPDDVQPQGRVPS